MAKYEFTGEVKVEFGITLRRIRALIDIACRGVKKGDVGGWIEKENNLAQDSNAWVSGDAQVYGDAWVSGDALVYGNAQVSGDARVCKPVIVASRSDGYLFLCCQDKDKNCVVIAGCRYFSFSEAREHWQKTRGGTQMGNESLALVDHLERMAGLQGWI